MLDRSVCIDKLKGTKTYLTEKYGVSSMLLFGSLAKGTQKEGSDVDICVEMTPNLLKQASMKVYLEGVLGCDVDVVRMRPNLPSVFMQQINKYGIRVF